MKFIAVRITLIFILISALNISSSAQNVDYTAWIYQFTSWEGGIGGACWESGTEEYTRYGYIMDNQYNAETSVNCEQCNNNGNCTSTGTWASQTRNSTSATQVRVRIGAWEDDGTRCTYGGGDDCYTATNTWTTLTPLEYQSTQNNWSTGDGNHRAYARCDYQYTLTTIPIAVDNSTFAFTTGGYRPFWGSQGSWSNSGGDCATSGTITDNQTSSFSTTVNCIDQVSFQWRVSSEANYDFLRFFINGVQQNAISGTPGWATVTYALDPNIDNTLEWRYTKDGSVSSGDDRGFVDAISYSNYTIPVAGTNFGANTWNVSCYNGRSLNLAGVTYRGYYVENNLNINTQTHWASGSTPSSAPSYDGCSVGIDNHTTVHKRQGFPCGTYRIDVANHDDEIRVYVNGAQVYEHLGCCDPHTGIWTGFLTSTSTVEVRTAEGGGGSNTGVNLVDVTPALSGGGISNNQTICSGTSPSTISNASAATGAGTISYQWQSSPNNITWSNIGGAVGVTYSPPALTQTMYYRRRSTNQCGNVLYTNTITVNIHTPLNAGAISNNQSICSGTSPVALTSSANASGGNGFAYQWQSSLNNSTWSSIGGASGSTYTPPALTQTTYYRRRAISNCGEVLYTNTITITVESNSTAPSITPIAGTQCPSTSVTLSAGGGLVGAGSSIEWYTGATGTGSSLGSGSNISVAPSATTTYYARREGTCNTTVDASITINVKDFIYTPNGVSSSSTYCTDNDGWHHFYNGSDEIILSIQGDISGAAPGFPSVAITNAGAFHQERELGGVIDCANGVSNGEERFEMRRNWNVDFGGGTFNGSYNVRYYFPATEKNEIITAAAAFQASNPSCNYTFKYANPDGFYWFKNTGSNYSVAYDGLHLTAAGGSVNSVNYSEITGVTSFSGGSGAIILIPDPSLSPLAVEFVSFEGWANGKVNELAWQTASLINSEKFEVERMTSLDYDFVKIGELASPGNITSLLTFNFTDDKPVSGINYYRVNEVDFDGTITSTKVVAVTQDTGSDYQLYPNPTNGEITYSFSSISDGERNIIIMDLSGRIVENKTINSISGNNTINFNLTNLAKGPYMFRVTNSEGITLVTERVVVQ